LARPAYSSHGAVLCSESATRKDTQEDSAPAKFEEEEHRAHGGVQLSVYWEYIKAGKLPWWVFLVGVNGLHRLFVVGKNFFVKSWGEAYDRPKEHTSGMFDRFPSPNVDVKPWLIAFFLITIAQSFLFLLSQLAFLILAYNAGRQMFKRVITCVSHATFRFYDVTPAGRLMNRLTSDISTIDGNIGQQLQNVARYAITWTASVVVIASVTPVFLAFSVVLTIAFVLIFRLFLPTSQSLRRLEVGDHLSAWVLYSSCCPDGFS